MASDGNTRVLWHALLYNYTHITIKNKVYVQKKNK